MRTPAIARIGPSRIRASRRAEGRRARRSGGARLVDCVYAIVSARPGRARDRGWTMRVTVLAAVVAGIIQGGAVDAAADDAAGRGAALGAPNGGRAHGRR